MSEPSPYTTRPFITTSGDYFATVMKFWLRSRGWIILLPVIFFLALGLMLADERWILVALMVVFIIFPMVMSMIYTSYMFTPEARRAVLPKRVIITPGKSLRLEYVSNIEIDQEHHIDNELPQSGNPDEKLTPTEEHDEKLPPPETIPWSEIIGESSTSTHKIYRLKGRLQFILIPWSSYPRPAK